MTYQKLSTQKLAFYVALIYVVLATVYSYWSVNNTISDGVFYYLFFPASVFPTLILFSESNSGVMIFFCQAITMFLLWPIFGFIIHLFRGDYNKKVH